MKKIVVPGADYSENILHDTVSFFQANDFKSNKDLHHLYEQCLFTGSVTTMKSSLMLFSGKQEKSS